MSQIQIVSVNRHPSGKRHKIESNLLLQPTPDSNGT